MSRMKAVQPYWPRRLLHVGQERLTSVERTGESTYGAFEQPSYNIISYTWGRFASESGQCIEVDNIPWAVPRIQPEHFTADEFNSVIREIASGVTHIWIDIACIDQQDNDIKLDEIGNQAAIFDRAETAYIWLNHCHRREFEALIELLRENVSTLDSIFLAKKDLIPLLRSIKQNLQNVLGDPWFSSLWTLQEAFLRPDAQVVLAGGYIDPDTTLSSLVSYLAGLNSKMDTLLAQQTYTLRRPNSLKAQLAQALMGMVTKSGAPMLNKENGLILYVASSYRTAWNPLDKVYGIMQVFGLVLGGAAYPGREFTLEELEYQLGAGMNEASPVYAQLFVHSEDPALFERRSWCIRNNVSIPPRVSATILPDAACRFHFDREIWLASFEGKWCGFRSMSEFWRKGWAFETRAQTHRTHRNERVVPKLMLEGGSYEGGAGELNDILETEYGPDISVLLLGKLRDIHRGRRNGYCWAGVLAHPVREETPASSQSSGMQQDVWTRIGICLWEVVDESLEAEQETLFSPCNLILG
ncbi:hypothetical protein VM1G_10023 [Cytospora mali]|uniref:Heterokaryon incompatibility domain-containing protein n=1 Tax=Cytospora mali TaxID=578113 RepID=A0A194WE00_CYTMA|nr:hypothetical protein VM1G_10023 [Valsa mali]